MKDTTDVSTKDESVNLNLSTHVLAVCFLVSFIFFVEFVLTNTFSCFL